MIFCRVTGHKAVIELSGPVTRADGIRSMSDQLSDTCSGVTGGDEARVVAVIGSGENPFSWGEGYNDLLETAAPGPGLFRSPAESLGGLELPVIVGIQGDALGPGLEMVLACDIRIAAEGARFGLPQIDAGFIPCDGGTQRLSRIVGKAKALEMVLTGETIDAREALRIGLVNRVVPKEEVVKTVMDMAGEMVSRAPVAMRYAKEAVLNGMDMTLEQGLRLEADLYFLLHATRDRTEGITAFREKKKPRFEGK
jgi:enoyl-CoA hydratase/carnithine racemase